MFWYLGHRVSLLHQFPRYLRFGGASHDSRAIGRVPRGLALRPELSRGVDLHLLDRDTPLAASR